MSDATVLKVWECKIGEVEAKVLPPGSDAPMRRAVEEAYQRLTGAEPAFLFSGWGGALTEPERAVVENRLPSPTGEVPAALKIMKMAMQADPSFAWTWHCAVACCAMDEGAPHDSANAAAARFMKQAFDVDTSQGS